MAKQKFKDVLLAAVPTDYEGLGCWCPVDSSDEKLLKNANIIKALVPIESRSLPQNALWAVWYGLIATWTQGEMTAKEVKMMCKLHFGVMLYREQDETFRSFYDSKIKKIFTYEEKIALMEIVPVTSKLSKDNGQKYQAEIQKYYAEKGLVLEVL